MIRGTFRKSDGQSKYEPPPPKATYTNPQPSLIVRKTPAPDGQQPPSIPIVIPEPFNYKAAWWMQYSLWYREQQGWTCEVCKISLYKNKNYLHTHHIWNTQFNDPKDLQALCIACHSEQPGAGHRRLKQTQAYSAFMRKYGKQWKLQRPCE